jgi:Trypsin
MQTGILLAGVHNLIEDDAEYELDITPSHVIMHEKYVAENTLNDIALINVKSSPFSFSTNAIQAILLPKKNFNGSEIVGKITTIAGW